MNILLVSQCKKNALKETRRIIDQFAERCGDRTWQTTITEAGLKTLHKLLRQTARKNTAVTCYWTRGKNNTELLWVVGDRSQFNDDGRVPTNRSQRNLLRSDSENSWQYATSIQIIATLAALLHDLGKTTIGFQHKLTNTSKNADPYRHEWISLQLFRLMVKDCKTNQEVLKRLAYFNDYQKQNPDWFTLLSKEIKNDLTQLPSLAQWIGWLIVSHHRMPIKEKVEYSNFFNKRRDGASIERLTLERFYCHINAVEGWVWNKHSEHPKESHFWLLEQSVTQSDDWLKSLSRWANKALLHPPLMMLAQQDIINDAFLMHLSRLSLMVGDHNYSSQPASSHSFNKTTLIANTDKNRQPKQKLDEHLIGVAKFTAQFSRLLPLLSRELPSLTHNKAFTKRTTVSRFQWQNRAFDLAKNHCSEANNMGFFGVNMASTGCGKTLANGRIMYALADPKRGARFTIALGLRVLTLQTGKALREKLQLDEEQLAILVGGKANQLLFELNNEPQEANITDFGSDSEAPLVDGFVDTISTAIDEDLLGTVIRDSKAKKLLYAPIVTCTVDHIIQASECARGGKYIAPTLRLLTSDLILDEPDDFDQNDLPALARLVHLAGLFGSKVLLSSATLTPDLITGLFDAYQAGRKIWQKQNNNTDSAIVCGWFDEFRQQIQQADSCLNFRQQHNQFVEHRVEQLQKAMTRRQGQIMPLLDHSVDTKLDYKILARQLLQQAHELHLVHHNVVPNSQKLISTGLIRFARTRHLINTIKECYELTNLPENTEFHIVVYHARQLLLLRSCLEEKLDRILNRSNPESLFDQKEIKQALQNSDAKHHIFIVAGTPVTEVGRDHDYDWAIVEPSSMRSIIQLAGRVWRHRPEKEALQPNIAILPSNISAMKKGLNSSVGEAHFTRPGFESKPFFLKTHKSNELITEEQLKHINAIARIEKPAILSQANTLAELEHQVMANLFSFDKQPEQSNYVTSYWQPNLAHHHCHHLPLISPFRQTTQKQAEYICQLTPTGYSFSLADIAWQTPNELCPATLNYVIVYENWSLPKQQKNIKPWLTMKIEDELSLLSEQLSESNLNRLALQFCTVTLDEKSIAWYFHPWFGFYENSLNEFG